ncbi:MAG: HD domain-containing protein [Lachnospiraceae bacterium]|nr:HD domain-containing protein [Lachnospiraceae bacterium]
MIINIIRFFKFIRSTSDVLSSGRRRDKAWAYTAFILLVFFLFGYIIIALFSKPGFLMSMVLFWGSVFVAIILTLIFNLLGTAKERSIDIAQVLIGVIDARDPNLNGHSKQVQDVTMLLYNSLPFYMIRDINPISLQYAALIHDVGKLGIPEAILNKPEKLTAEEWQIMKTHPQVGVDLLKSLNTFDDISDWILYHHERVDGNGYYKIPEEEIPLASKIIAIADTYSAITMRRSYKDARTHEEAIQIIKEVAGTQLDEELVEYFLTIPKEDLIACMPES